MAELDQVDNTFLTAVQTLANLVDATLKLVPSNSSGKVSATKVIQTGFVRVTGISVVAGGAVGALHDASTTASIASANQIYVVPTTPGFYAVNLVFPTGLAYVPGASQTAAFMYSRQ